VSWRYPPQNQELFEEQRGREEVCPRNGRRETLSWMAVAGRDSFLVGDNLYGIVRRSSGDAKSNLISQAQVLYIVEHSTL